MIIEERAGFSLQKITIELKALTELQDIEKRIQSAKATYDWIYQKEGPHDVLVKILLPMNFHSAPQSGVAESIEA